MIRSPWAREYARAPRTYIWGTEASLLARQVSAVLPPGARVLDLGCGEGRDSVFFAERGFDVTGVDIARSGLSKAERLASARGVRVRWVRGHCTAEPPTSRAGQRGDRLAARVVLDSDAGQGAARQPAAQQRGFST
jgi:SAM-dependent methyltransferase